MTLRGIAAKKEIKSRGCAKHGLKITIDRTAFWTTGGEKVVGSIEDSSPFQVIIQLICLEKKRQDRRAKGGGKEKQFGSFLWFF